MVGLTKEHLPEHWKRKAHTIALGTSSRDLVVRQVEDAILGLLDECMVETTVTLLAGLPYDEVKAIRDSVEKTPPSVVVSALDRVKDLKSNG